MLITYEHTDPYSFMTAVLSVISSLSTPKRKLQEQQIELLARLLTLPEKYRSFPFSLQAKKYTISTFYPGLTLRQMNSRLLNLKSKGYLVTKEDGEIYINDFLVRILKQYPKFSLNVLFNKKEDTKNS